MNGEATTFSRLQVPAEYQVLHIDHLDACIHDVAYLYAAYARDRKYGTSEASNFRDALKQHEFIDQIVQASEIFSK